MAKTGYKVDYIIRDIGSDLSDLLTVHQKVFKGNQLAMWKTDTKVIVKVSNTGQVSGKSLSDAKTTVGYIDTILPHG